VALDGPNDDIVKLVKPVLTPEMIANSKSLGVAHNFSLMVQFRYERTGVVAELDDAIRFRRKAIEVRRKCQAKTGSSDNRTIHTNSEFFYQ